MKLDVSCMRYLTKDDYRVLTAVEMGMRNHEMVPVPLITSIAKLRHGGSYKILSTLLRYKLVAHTNQEYNGYRLSYLGFDILALRSLLARNTIVSVGQQIGVGKESDIFEALTEEGEEVVIKVHRLGRTSFRSVRRSRDYMNGKSKASWLFMSRLAALKEYSFMKALHAHEFPVPTPIDQNRHIVVMSKVPGSPMSQIKSGNMYGAEAVFAICMEILRRLAAAGLVHCDFNEFNLMIDGEGTVTLIDFPQMVSTSHANASELFRRDINCLIKFFAMKMRYIAPEELTNLRLTEVVPSSLKIDEQVRASGAGEVLTSEEDAMLTRFIMDTHKDGEEGGEEEESDDEEEDEGGKGETEMMADSEPAQISEDVGSSTSAPAPAAAPAVAGDGDRDADEDGNVSDLDSEDGEAEAGAGAGAAAKEGATEGTEVVTEADAEAEATRKKVTLKVRRDIFKRGEGASNKSRNATKKRNKYGKIDKAGGSKLMNDY